MGVNLKQNYDFGIKMNKKIVALIFGGKSAEHEVSLRSAKNVADALDKDLFKPILIGISKEGSWYRFSNLDVFNLIAIEDNDLPSQAEPIALISIAGKPILIYLLFNYIKLSYSVSELLFVTGIAADVLWMVAARYVSE